MESGYNGTCKPSLCLGAQPLQYKLLQYYPEESEKYGVDPSDIAQEIKGNITVVQDIFPSEELKSRLQENKLDIITSIAMFYDLEDPIAFTKGIKDILSPEGIWIFEIDRKNRPGWFLPSLP